jgi:hypothetical protein
MSDTDMWRDILSRVGKEKGVKCTFVYEKETRGLQAGIGESKSVMM